MHLTHHVAFRGNAVELASLAVTCAQAMGLPVDAGKMNERLVRYYVTEGVLDRPDRVGREAAYGFRHLLQLLTAKRMVDAGMALAVVSQHNQAATTAALEQALARPLPTAAELLVQSYMVRESPAIAYSHARSARSSSKSAPALPASQRPAPVPAPALADVLAEVRQMRDDVLAGMQRLSIDLQQVNDRLNALEQAYGAQREGGVPPQPKR